MVDMSSTAVAPLAAGPFDTVLGLPLHPLVVHAAVVLVPLAALGLVAIVVVRRLRAPLGWLVMAALPVAAGSAFVAAQSGEALAERVGEPRTHAELGEVMPLLGLAMLVAGVAWFLVDRRGAGALSRVLAVAAVVIALVNVGWIARVGHTGAEAVWGSVTALPADGQDGAEVGAGDAADEAEDAEEELVDAGEDDTTTFTMDQVAAHASPGDCWAVVDGGVYDLSSWPQQHPGGAAAIEGLCGTDASAAFSRQHGGQEKPADRLADLRLGSLGQVATS